jgi:hypothetical protein
MPIPATNIMIFEIGKDFLGLVTSVKDSLGFGNSSAFVLCAGPSFISEGVKGTGGSGVMGLGVAGGGFISNDFGSGFAPFLAESISSPIVRIRDLNLSDAGVIGADCCGAADIGGLSEEGGGVSEGGLTGGTEGGVERVKGFGGRSGFGGSGVWGARGILGFGGIFKAWGFDSFIFGRSLSKSSMSFGVSIGGFGTGFCSSGINPL